MFKETLTVLGTVCALTLAVPATGGTGSQPDALKSHPGNKEIGFKGGSGPGISDTPGNACASDINKDGTVDFNDTLMVLAGWGACPQYASGNLNDHVKGSSSQTPNARRGDRTAFCPADVNGDSMVDFEDLIQVLVNYDLPCIGV